MNTSRSPVLHAEDTIAGDDGHRVVQRLSMEYVQCVRVAVLVSNSVELDERIIQVYFRKFDDNCVLELNLGHDLIDVRNVDCPGRLPSLDFSKKMLVVVKKLLVRLWI